MDDSAKQLQGELSESIKRALATRRPILTHINADTTWLLQLPYPRNATPPPGRSHYNILIDPWLQGSQVDVASWFSKQWHAVDSSVQTIAELSECLKTIEELAQTSEAKTKKIRSTNSSHQRTSTYLDAIILSHEFSDHTHKATLLQVDPRTPIYATQKAAELVRSWSYFDHVYTVPSFTTNGLNWKHTLIGDLPYWIGISRITTKTDLLYFHSAILIAFETNTEQKAELLENESMAEAIIYSPHGIVADSLKSLPSAVPPIQTLALLHGLHGIKLAFTSVLNLGAFNGLRIHRICQAKYWVGTHDEIKHSGGIIARLLQRKTLSVQDAIEKEKQVNEHTSAGNAEGMENVRFADLKSGESLLLE